jgi:RNA polymerase sigma factor (TIGR02999 family)
MRPSSDTTALLLDARAGRRDAADALFERLYDELRRLAHARLGAHAPGATLDTTGLVHEAYLRLVDRTRATPSDRAHFLALAARAMRFVLIDRARARAREKRGGPDAAVPLDDAEVAADERAADVLALDEALERLRDYAPRLAEVVEYRFFGGLNYEEVAEATGRSVATVERDWVRARVWLYRALQEAPRAAAGPASAGADEGNRPHPAIGG